SSASGTFTAQVYPNPGTHQLAFIQAAGGAALTSLQVTSGAGYSGTLDAATPQMTYQWSIDDGGSITGSATGTTVLFAAGAAGANGATATMTVNLRQMNAISDFADTRAAFTVFPAPVRPVITAPSTVTSDANGGATNS